MTELLDAISPPYPLFTVLLVFGVAPRFVLRLLIKLYPKGDPRRRELVAELYNIARVWRPMWVAEQVEVALFDGLGTRWRTRQRGIRQRLYRLSTLGLFLSIAATALIGYLTKRQTIIPYLIFYRRDDNGNVWTFFTSNSDTQLQARGISLDRSTAWWSCLPWENTPLTAASYYWWAGTAGASLCLITLVLSHHRMLRRTQ